MRPVDTVISPLAIPTLTMLGGPALDFSERLPTKFSWSMFTPPLDQGGCGACWAFASVGALNDRFLIWSDLRVQLSPYKMLICNLGGLEHDLNFDDSHQQINAERRALAEFECRGNSLDDAWRYLFTNGVPDLKCVPADALGSTCSQVVGLTENTCPTGAPMRTFRCRAYYSVPADEVMREIYQRGPVSAAFVVTRDFWGFDFKTGVYEPRTVGGTGHAVRIVGWGESASDGLWWWVVNSFGTSWGLNGLFRMRRGFLETNVIAGLPDAFGQAPLYAVQSDRLFRQRVERMHGSNIIGRKPQFYPSPQVKFRSNTPFQPKAKPKAEPPAVDLNINTSLYEDTHAIFRIAIFLIATICVFFLWFTR